MSLDEGDCAGWAAMGAHYLQREAHEGESLTDDLGEYQILVVGLPLVATHQVNGIDGRSWIVRRRRVDPEGPYSFVDDPLAA